MLQPLEIPMIRDKVLEYIGPKYFRQLRSVNHDWNQKTLNILSVQNWKVRLTTDNLDEYCGSQLLRIDARPKIKILLDFGSSPTQSEFMHMVDTIISTICFQDGAECIDTLKFIGVADSFQVTPVDWMTLVNLLQLLSPGLRTLELFGQDWRIPDGTFLHRRLYTGMLSFPNLQKLTYCWQEPTLFFLGALLVPTVVPELVKLEITARKCEDERSLYGLDLRSNLGKLHNFPRLTELRLGMDFLATAFLSNAGIQLPTIRILTIDMLRSRGSFEHPEDTSKGSQGLMGRFIGPIFPQLRVLALNYDADGMNTDSFQFPQHIGQLSCLESLSYRFNNGNMEKSSADDDDGNANGGGGGNGVVQLKAYMDELMQNNFPTLDSVLVDLGFELCDIHDHEPRQVQFLSVTKLEIRIGLALARMMLGVNGEPSEELRRCVINLHKLYPHITSLILELDNQYCSPAASMIDAITGAAGVNVLDTTQTLIEEFGPLEEIGLLNYDIEYVAQLLLENQTVKTHLQRIRSLSLKLLSSTGVAARSSNDGCTRMKKLSLGNMLASFPELEYIEVNEEPVAMHCNCSVGDIYTEAYCLQEKQMNMKIILN